MPSVNLRSDAHSVVDLFGRKGFVDSVVQAVSRAPPERSFIIGLNGPWGCGKTSVLKQIRKSLEEWNEARPPAVRDILVDFNPWQAVSLDQLMTELFEALEEGVETLAKAKGSQKRLARLSELFGGIATLGRWASLAFPGAGAIAEAAKQGKEVAALGSAKTATLRSLRSKAIAELKESDRRLVLFVDDLDRLEGSELREVIRLLRVVADFPNTVVVAAYDRTRVANALEPKNASEGNAYLEKIVQLSIDMPLYSREQVRSILARELKEIGASEIFVNDVIVPLFGTPREVNRFVNGLSLSIESRAELVAIDDLVGMEALRALARLMRLASASRNSSTEKLGYSRGVRHLMIGSSPWQRTSLRSSFQY